LKKGLTIIEIIVAITVFTIGVLGVAAFFGNSSRLAGAAGRISVASNLAQGLIDQEVNKSYDSLTPGTGIKTNLSLENTNPFYQYQKQVDIILIDSNLAISGTDIGLKKIIVTIYYNEGQDEKNVQMATIKSK